jgi:hypothetical protein
VLTLEESYTLAAFGVGTGIGGTIKCIGTTVNTFGPRVIDVVASTEQTGGNVLIATGMGFVAQHNQTVTTTTLRAFQLNATSINSGDISTLEGLAIGNSVTGAVPTDNRSLVIRSTLTKGTTVYGMEINDISNAANTTTYGLKIDDFANGTNKYLLNIGPAIPYFRVLGNATAVAQETPLYISWGTAAPAWALKQMKTVTESALDTASGTKEICYLV